MAKLADYELEEMYKDFIDDTTESVKIWGMEYYASQVLRECDPIAYRCGFNDWLDGLDNCEDCDLNPSECKCHECADCGAWAVVTLEPYGESKMAVWNCPNCGESYDTNLDPVEVGN